MLKAEGPVREECRLVKLRVAGLRLIALSLLGNIRSLFHLEQ
jgi:hypothetical protein